MSKPEGWLEEQNAGGHTPRLVRWGVYALAIGAAVAVVASLFGHHA